MMKRWLKAALRAVGYDIVQHVDTPQRPFPVLPYVVNATLAQTSDFFFVQVGANDGVRDDPLHSLVRKHKLRGLLVEPLPDVFERLRANYQDCRGLTFERCAIGPHDGQTKLYRIRPDAPVSLWFQGFSSVRRSHLSAGNLGTRALRDYVIEETVPCLTLNTLLRRHGITDVTLLQVDTEGADCDIVRMAIDTGLRPTIINYEFVHASPTERATCKRMLAEAGYRFLDVGMDTLAMREQ